MSEPGADLARLRRWEDAGGEWRVLDARPDEATVALVTCDGGTEMERFTTSEAAVLDLVRERLS